MAAPVKIGAHSRRLSGLANEVSDGGTELMMTAFLQEVTAPWEHLMR